MYIGGFRFSKQSVVPWIHEALTRLSWMDGVKEQCLASDKAEYACKITHMLMAWVCVNIFHIHVFLYQQYLFFPKGCTFGP